MAMFLHKTPASNTVQPGGNASFTKASSNAVNDDELSTEVLIQASKQLPVRLEKLQQENKCLKQQVESLKRSRGIEESFSLENRRLLAEIERLKQRNAAMAERKVNMDQRRTENTLSRNRQSDLEREYKDDFRDGKRMDAIETIEAHLKKHKKTTATHLSQGDQLKAYRLACCIFEIAYECALSAKEKFLSFYSSLIETLVTDAPMIALSDEKYRKLPNFKVSKQSTKAQDSLNELMVLVKEEAARHDLEKLVKSVKKELKQKWKNDGKNGETIPSFDKNLKIDLQGYIEYCTRFSWRMVTQVPPLKIDYKSSTFNPSSHTESQAFTSSSQRATPGRWIDSQERKQIKCHVWPTLFDWDNRVIEKGDVVFKENSLHISAV